MDDGAAIEKAQIFANTIAEYNYVEPVRKQSLARSAKINGHASKTTQPELAKSDVSAKEIISPRKRKRASPVETTGSRTATALKPLPDTLPAPTSSTPFLLLFIGANPGLLTSATSTPYAHPTNHFWTLLHKSGLTPAQVHRPADHIDFPDLYGYAFTNLVSRPSRTAAEVTRAEEVEGWKAIQAKVGFYRPRAVCVVGKGVWEGILRAEESAHAGKSTKKKAEKGTFTYGWQDGHRGRELLPGTRIFVATTTSALAAGMSMDQKIAVWKELGKWIAEQRVESNQRAEITL